jgi:hypothetical protein
LLPVESATGVRCYLGKYEVDASDVKALPRERLIKAFSRVATIPFDSDGEPLAGGTNATEISQGLTSSLGVTKLQAMELAEAFGCRLPLAAEWNAVRALGLAPGSAAYNAVLDRRMGQVDAGIREWLQVRGDEIASRAGGDSWIGMLIGVREWCSDRDEPVGCSRRCGCGPAEAKWGAVDDVGMRLALDAVPRELREFDE